MLDVKKQLVNTLKPILPTYYELFVDSSTPTPCITYLESNNSDNLVGDDFGYSNIKFNVKVWGKSVDDLASYSTQVDEALRKIGYRRTSSNELTMNDQICKIMTYEGLGLEIY